MQKHLILSIYYNFSAERFKQKVQFILLERNFVDILDACKIADYILFVVSAEMKSFSRMRYISIPLLLFVAILRR